MCGRFGLVEMAPKELWKAKVGFQKQKLIALHLAFQCHVALSYTHAEWKPLPRQGAWGEGAGAGIPGRGRPLAGAQEDHSPPHQGQGFPCSGCSSQVGAGQVGGRSPALSLGSLGDGVGVGPLLP